MQVRIDSWRHREGMGRTDKRVEEIIGREKPRIRTNERRDGERGKDRGKGADEGER